MPLKAGAVSAAGLPLTTGVVLRFFHASMPDEPLIFVEEALTKGRPGSIRRLLAEDRDTLNADEADTSDEGRAQSGDIMVNYIYDLQNLSQNHEKFATSQVNAASLAVNARAKSAGFAPANEG